MWRSQRGAMQPDGRKPKTVTKPMSKRKSKPAKTASDRWLAHRRRVLVRKQKLKDLVEAAHAVGAKVSVSLEPKQMPMRFPGDPEPVKLLLDESERMSKLGNNWMVADVPNQVAAEMCLRHGWAFSLAAAWMRCKLKGEMKPESKAH